MVERTQGRMPRVRGACSEQAPTCALAPAKRERDLKHLQSHCSCSPAPARQYFDTGGLGAKAGQESSPHASAPLGMWGLLQHSDSQ